MRLTLVRHATLVLETGVGRVLVDPMLGTAGTTPPIENTPNQLPNPLVELSFDVDTDVDLCIVTHLHGDHSTISYRTTSRSLPSPRAPTSCGSEAIGTSTRSTRR